MSDRRDAAEMTRRELLGTMARGATASVVLSPFLESAVAFAQGGGIQPPSLAAVAGPDRINVLPGKTYLNAWAGYGAPPLRGRRRTAPPPASPGPQGPPPALTWTKVSGPGTVTFADPKAPVTTATFSAPGEYELRLTADNGQSTAASTVHVLVEREAARERFEPVMTSRYRVDGSLWSRRLKVLIASWIPQCVDLINRTDLPLGPGGIDNFDDAAKALRGEPHGPHKGYVFSNAWVYQTIEAMSLALMVDPQGDREILAAQAKMRATLEDWIPRILAAQETDGYLQTAFTLRDPGKWAERWYAPARGNHEGYVAGYFLEAAINHYVMTGRRDARLYRAARKLADCWCDNLGPPPKKAWSDGHQEMEQALVRFGRFVNEVEGSGGDRYVALAKFLLDSRQGGTEYDQSHLPVVQQYEAVGHAVRAVYTYAAMTDIVLETRDIDYQSAVRSIWDNVVNRKYYVTGGVGSGETSEGFGPDYSLRQNGYCESCSSCGEIFFQWKMNRAYRDARYADVYEETLYNALLGSIDLAGRNFYYDNPLDANVPRYPWHTCPCCVGNIPRTLLMLPTWMYARGPDSLCVNLFVGSTVTVGGVAGTDVEVTQKTEYPWDGKVAITVSPNAPARFALRIRVPNRAVSRLYTRTPDARGLVSISVNGTPERPVIERGYAVITRTWKTGDTVELALPLPVQRVHASDRIAACRGRVALQVGPLLYNIETADQDITKALAPAAPLASEWRADVLGGVRVITGTFTDGSPLMAIPNFARYNRGPLPSPPLPPPAPAGGRPEPPSGATARPAPPPATSIVWLREEG